MKNAEIVNGNKLIVEFIGDKWVGESHVYDKYSNLVAKDEFSEYVTCFHDDWNSLMQVVEKISEDFDVSITLNKKALDVTYISRTDISDGEIYSMGGMTSIENTWHSVVKFIEWYNTKSKFRKK